MDPRVAARTSRIWRGGRIEEVAGKGDGLARAIDEGGSRCLAALLAPDVERVELEDGDVRIEVERSFSGLARVHTRWSSGEESDQDIPIEVRVGDLGQALHDASRTLHFRGGEWFEGPAMGTADFILPAIYPEQLGSGAFRRAHGVRAAYVAGAMAGGIAGTRLVQTMGRAGLLGYFGAGGLPLEAVEVAVSTLAREANGDVFGANLLHNPAEPAVEERTVDLYLAHGVRDVDASAYMNLTSAVVRYRLSGIHQDGDRIVVPNRLAAKVSRPEVAEPFLRPAPPGMIAQLVKSGVLTESQAILAARVPMADDVTAEADSGGHTDRRPLSVLIPVLRRLADRVAAEQGYSERPRVGAAGGIGDPWSFAAALQLGADYVMTGSINQATVEADTSDVVKTMLAEAAFSDVIEGPAPDMFEIGAKVQVLARGTMYAKRAERLHDLYTACDGLDAIPAADRERIEKQIFLRPLSEVWAETERYWNSRDPKEVERAKREPRHQMALTFRWYLGMSSRWARTGEPSRKRDFQVWCGPAMGLFNDWVRGTWLEPLEERKVAVVADSLMWGACVALRLQMLRSAGLPTESTHVLAPHR